MRHIHGFVAPGFEDVRREFERNFAERGEVGAACAAFYNGRPVVDLWGGLRDPRTRAEWEQDTLVLVFSTTKGMSALAMAVANSRGLFSYDDRVARYWPEFAQNGKAEITIRQLLSHQAGLSCIDTPLTLDHMFDLDALAGILARQKPLWTAGTRHGYHGISIGWYEAELLRRVDPLHRTLGKFFQDELAKPLGLEFYIGTPRSIPESRIATLIDSPIWHVALHLNSLPAAFAARILNPFTDTSRTFRNPYVKSAGVFGNSEWRVPEIPAANGIGQVRSMARAYSAFALGGDELGITHETMAALTQQATPPTEGDFDEIIRTRTRFSMGFFRPFDSNPFGSPSAFGHPGLGGSNAFADPETKIAFAYAPNKLGFYLWDDPRERALRNALQQCVREQAKHETSEHEAVK